MPVPGDDPSRDRYRSSLSARHASPAMQWVWSDRFKFATWRRLWLALAEAQHEVGLPVTGSQVDALRAALDDIDFARAAEHERATRHDVMAHIRALAECAPDAGPIVHLGATSQFVVCNTELIQARAALELVAQKAAKVIDRLGVFAHRHRDLPTVGWTHLQPAQPTTVGKRAAVWAHDLALGLAEVEHRLETLRFRGLKGATGTQASFLALCNGDHARVDRLDRLVCQKMGWETSKRFVVTGQTYPRVLDGMLVGALAAVAAACAKMAGDVRILSHRKEIDEPFEAEQVGSSAMPYKRNPMRSERIGGLCRFVIGQAQTPYVTAAEQWLERTLDDSACRRLTLPEPFLALDGALDLAANVAGGLVVHKAVIERALDAELPFMASENVLMAACEQGGDRQALHEAIREHAQAAAARVKGEGADNDLLERLRGDDRFAGVDLSSAMEPMRYVGRAPEQVDAAIEEVVEPIRRRYAEALQGEPDLRV
ncbi:MAG: adenylosuccinate lyase [Planctomycetota bacterium]